jgi:predicted ATPase
MTQSTSSLFKVVKAIEEKGHFAAIFLRGNTNYKVASITTDPDLPGLWICTGAQGHKITIDASQVTSVVEHES